MTGSGQSNNRRLNAQEGARAISTRCLESGSSGPQPRAHKWTLLISVTNTVQYSTVHAELQLVVSRRDAT